MTGRSRARGRGGGASGGGRPPADVRGALSPHGALATRFGGDRAPDDVFRRLAAGARRFDLGDHGALLAEEVLRLAPMLAGPDRTAVALALLATDVAARQGSTCVPLAPGGPLRELVAALVAAAGLDLDVDDAVAGVLRGARGGQLGFGAPIGPAGGDVRPLVVDGDRLYQHRLWWLERALAERLAPRLAGAAPPPELAAAVDDVIARPGAFALTAEQAGAVRAALAGTLGVISGGPGTGKTAIVVAIVRALARLAPGAVALAAPTGKAANRMTSSVRAALAAIADPAPADASLAGAPPAALTLHRLLGWRPDGEFRHGERSPLPHAAVIVDEASMIDLALMERLVRALAPGARLILLGDAEQLPSVDAGAVLADLVALARARGAAWATELTESHRMRPDDPNGRAILEAARQIKAGDVARLPGTHVGFVAPRGEKVERAGIDPPERLGAALDAWFRDLWRTTELPRLAARAYRRRAGAWVDEDLAPLEALLALHERRRILTVTRGLDTGAEAVNAHLHRRMLERSSAELAPEVVPGEPVIMTVNDYERGLYNGDQGVVVRVVDDDGAQRYRAVFRRADGLVPLPLDAVRASMELAWAITVHKSQGSEFDRVAIVLPREDQPLCTRELIYTALTRARSGALILGDDAVLAAACARTAARRSGLVARLLGGAGAGGGAAGGEGPP